MEDTMCDYSLEAYRSRPARVGERYETHRFESYSIGCMAYDTKLRLEGIPEVIQRSLCASADEDVTFTRLEKGPHRDGVRFANGAEVALQRSLVTDVVKSDLLSPPVLSSPVSRSKPKIKPLGAPGGGYRTKRKTNPGYGPQTQRVIHFG
jgi:hypothetical protein